MNRVRDLVLHPFAGLALVFAAATALFFARAHAAGQPWLDEEFTILTAEHDAARIVAIAAEDAHPPLYYLLQRFWTTAIRATGIEPDAVVGRTHGLVWRLLCLGIVWFAGRRSFGARGAAIFAWLVALAPRILEASAEMRQYAVVAPAMPALFATMWAADALDRDAGAHRRRASIVGAWSMYGILAAVCLWSHYAAGFSLLAMGLMWIAMCAARGLGSFKSSFFAGGAIAQGAVVLSFVPWISRIVANVRYVAGANVHEWMTPPTVQNLFTTTTGWMPFGSFFDRLPAPWPKAIVATGAAAFLLPVAARLLVGRRGTDDARTGFAGICGLAAGTFAVAGLWMVSRAGIASIFHGPRYPVVGLGLWIAGLALLCESTVRRSGRPIPAATALLPWLALSAGGIVQILAFGYRVTPWGPENPPPPAGTRIYAMPSELVPYARDAFAEWDMRPIEELPDHPPGENAVVLRFATIWWKVYPERDRWLLVAMNNDRLCREWSVRLVEGAYVYELRGLRRETLALFGEREWEEFRRPSIGRAVSEAGVEWQNPSDGWYKLEFDDNEKPIRRAITSPAIARFNRPVPPGNYLLRVAGYQQPHPSEKSEWQFRFPDEPEHAVVQVPAGEFEIVVPVKFSRFHEKPIVAIKRPVWIPADTVRGSSDIRPFAFTLRRMWLEKAPDPQ